MKKTRDKKENVFVKYTLCFSLISLFIILIFIRFRKGFMWGADGFHQHMISLSYWRFVLLEFFSTGKFLTFTWSVGCGIDTFANLAYYVMGDFLSILSVFFTEDKLYLLYYMLCFVRIYLVGVSFICYCKYRKMSNSSALIGSLMYAFCGYCLYSCFRHPYFINSVALFPILMMGIEKIVKENKKKFYIFSIALATFCNFYFAYSFFVIIGIYGILLIINTYRKDGIKKIIKKLFEVLGCSLLGIFLMAVVLLPTAYLYFNTARVGFDVYPYSFSYYRNFLPSLVNFSIVYWRIFTVHGVILITLPYFIKKRKEDYPKFLLLLILLIPLLISQVGSAFMGFSFPNNRWSFVVAFLLCYMTSFFFNEKKQLSKDDKKFIIGFDLVYIILLFISKVSINHLMLFWIIIVLFLMIVLFNDDLSRVKKERYSLILMIVGICYMSYYLFGVENNNYSSEFLNFNAVNNRYKTNEGKNRDLDDALEYINERDDGFNRLYINNTSLFNLPLKGDYNYNSIMYAYSIYPKEIWQISDDIKNSMQNVTKSFSQLNNRSKITTLLGNKYYISKDELNMYGYKLLDYEGESKIYENKYSLPFVMFYDKTISEDEYFSLTPLEKEASMLKQVVVEGDGVKLDEGVTNFSNEIKSYSYDESKLLVKNSDDKILLSMKNKEALKASEVYVYIKGLKYTPKTKEEIIEEKTKNLGNKQIEIAKIKEQYKNYVPTYDFDTYISYDDKKLSINTKDYKTDPYYVDHSVILMNLGYFEEFNKDVELSFSKEGMYSFDSIEIVGVSMKNYEKDINLLKRSNFEMKEYDDNYLEGSIELEDDGIIKFSTIYSEGWDIFIDDKKVDSLKLNNGFLGARVDRGWHSIRILYHTPYLKEGMVITILTSVILVIGYFIEKKIK